MNYLYKASGKSTVTLQAFRKIRRCVKFDVLTLLIHFTLDQKMLQLGHSSKRSKDPGDLDGSVS